MKTQSCKAKGRRLQQMVVNDLLRLYPQLSCDDIRSTTMGVRGEDVQLSPAARLVIPFSFEAKNVEKLNVWSAIEQARANAPTNTQPVVVMKKNNEKPHVVISWDLFVQLMVPNHHGAPECSVRDKVMLLAAELQTIAGSLPEETRAE